MVDPSGLAGMVVMFPGYKVDTGKGFRIPLVHAGVVAINNKTGAAQYFEFGRYGGEYGDVKSSPLGNVSFNQNGSLTRESTQTINSKLSKFGQNITPTTIYNSTYNADSIANFAINQQNNIKQRPYTINPFSSNSFNTCVNFAVGAFQAGGSNK